MARACIDLWRSRVAVNVNRRAFVGLGLAWLASTRAYAADDPDIRGVWSSVARTGKLDTTGDQMIFTSSNATLSNGLLLLDGTYTIDGNRITLTPKDERHGATESVEFKIVGNKLLLRGPHLSRMIMIRDGKIRLGADPIVGDWIFPFSFMGLQIRIVRRFSRNGATQLAMPLDVDYGPYRLVGNTMQLELVRQDHVLAAVRDVTLTVKREGNLLITRDADGNEKHFTRFEYGQAEV